MSIPEALLRVLGPKGAGLQLDESFVEYLTGSCEEVSA
jgi:hypothetical protein